MSDPSNSNPEELADRLAARDQARAQLAEAQEALDRETYRLDTLDIELDLAQEEIDKLESVSMAGVVSALMGTKAGKLDALREEFQTLEREQQECEKSVETLTATVDQLIADLDRFADLETPTQAVEDREDSTSSDRSPNHNLERTLDAGDALLRQLDGAFRSVNRIKRGGIALAGGGALVAAAVGVYKNRVAGGLTGTITDSICDFCDRLGQLPLGPDYLPDVCALLPRLQHFAEPASLGRKADANVWAECEALVRSVVADLQEQCKSANV